jgi:hypothetical protein
MGGGKGNNAALKHQDGKTSENIRNSLCTSHTWILRTTFPSRHPLFRAKGQFQLPRRSMQPQNTVLTTVKILAHNSFMQAHYNITCYA